MGRRLIALGTNTANMFGDICTDPVTFKADNHKTFSPDRVVAMSKGQVIYATRDEQRVEGLTKWEAKASEPATWLGKDDFLAVLDGKSNFHSPVYESTSTHYVAVAVDGQSRLMGISQEEGAELWPTLDSAIDDDIILDAKVLEAPICFDDVQAGWAHFVLLSQDSRAVPVWLYGDTRFGAVPQGSKGLVSCSFFQGFPSRIVQVCAGGRHSMARTEHGDVYVWGWNGECQIAPHTDGNILFKPAAVPIKEQIVAFAAGSAHSILVDGKGNVYVAGSNEHKQLGDLPEGTPKKPKAERSFSQIKQSFDCTDGFIKHPHFGAGKRYGKAVSVMCSDWATIITVDR